MKMNLNMVNTALLVIILALVVTCCCRQNENYVIATNENKQP